MLRTIREIQPRWVVGENVLGLVNWNGGLVFEEVQADLEAEGYEVQPFILPAASVNAPHKRDRVWFVAYSVNGGHYTKRGEVSKEDRIQEFSGQKMESREFDGTSFSPTTPYGKVEHAPDTDSDKRHKRGLHQAKQEKAERHIGTRNARSNFRPTWDNFPTQSPIRSRNDGLPTELDGITFSKWRNESIKAGGNAIVPQVVYQIFKSINEYENLHTNRNNT